MNKMLQFDAWNDYRKFVKKYFKNDPLRTVLFYETFIKCLFKEKEYYQNDCFFNVWVFYADMCAELDIFNYMNKHEIGTLKTNFYYYFSFFMRKFINSMNEMKLEGFSNRKLDDHNLLRSKYL